MQISSSSSAYQSLSTMAQAGFSNGKPFSVTAPTGDGSGETETLSGSFGYTMLEPAGDNSLFDPNNPTAPNAGTKAFEASVQQFLGDLQLDDKAGAATADSSSKPMPGTSLQLAAYHTASSFQGQNIAMDWTGDLKLNLKA